MVRLADVDPAQRKNLEGLDCPSMPSVVIHPARPLADCRVALVSSAGLMQRNEDNVPGNSADYRIIPDSTADADVLMNHVSVNFDRTGFTEDINCVFPRDRLKALEQRGVIGAVSADHYSFMGATPPAQMKENVDKLVAVLNGNNVNTVCLLPV